MRGYRWHGTGSTGIGYRGWRSGQAGAIAFHMVHPSTALSAKPTGVGGTSGGEGGIRECLAFALSETLVESKRTRHESPLFLPAPTLQASLHGTGCSMARTGLGPDQVDRCPQPRVPSPSAGVMFFETVIQIGGHANVVTAISTFQDIARPALRLAHSDSLAQGIPLKRDGGEGGILLRHLGASCWKHMKCSYPDGMALVS